MQNPVTESLIRAVRKQVKPAPDSDTLAFLKDYYHRLSGQDYSPAKVMFLFEAAMLHRAMAEKRRPGKPALQINQIALEDGSIRNLISIVTDDKPFIINSLTITINLRNKRLERTIHPLFEVTRDNHHRIKSIQRFRSGEISNRVNRQSHMESFIQFETEALAKTEQQELLLELRKVLSRIDIITEDWGHMRDTALSLAEMIERNPQGPAFAEYGELLRWMAEDHFAFIGYAELEVDNSTAKTKIITSSLSGNLRSAHSEGEDILTILPPLVQSKVSPVIFTKSSKRIHIYRANYLDCILIDHGFSQAKTRARTKRRVSCILGFLGGSTSTMPVATIPHLRSKASFILSESTLRMGSYAYKELRGILETMPREMLFQLGSKDLYGLCMTLLNHQERHKTRVYIRSNICGHFYSCLVYVPRDLFNSKLRQKILRYLEQQLQAKEVTFNVYFSESILTRIHFTAHINPGSVLEVSNENLERAIQGMARDFNENLLVGAQKVYSLDAASNLLDIWRNAFPAHYCDSFTVEQALDDIGRLGFLVDGKINQKLELANFSEDESADNANFKIYSTRRPAPLSDVLPVLENLGVRVMSEYPYRITTTDRQEFWINNFQIIRRDGHQFDSSLCSAFEQAFHNIWQGNAENDGFNQLTLLSGIGWREVSVVRSYFRYLKQIRLRYSESYVIETLVKNPGIVGVFCQLFSSMFDPDLKKRQSDQLAIMLEKQLNEVKTLDEERILRALVDVLLATLRTSFFQKKNGNYHSYTSFKINSRQVPRIPEPAPKYEIFVYSPRMEGVHLRGGDVARGGLRWSERPEDFRTEVLGLVKAQRVKNAVIVPVGSKGGFVCKQLPGGPRERVQEEVIFCYKMFISSMLDITDNYIGNQVKPPEQVVRQDGDDPYLVVAADKGTATFSDIANSLSAEYGFWLGDAFASGGSAGYDHKKMGITARGAWESVKRHFRELNKNIQQQDFTVVGIGDMGGDVFGNGMLLSKHIKLIAAFNHMHIFVDPNPDATRSFAERQRLFNLPRSSWQDYNSKLISNGGGIYERTAKSIKLSSQAQKALAAETASCTPDELINIILKAEVELLWNGGIGTYIKASTETHIDAQDRNNDGLRVDGNQVRAKVIGEGGNLGVTQLGRVEYSNAGGYCYTDAIDNSAGVDTSDHEVNIKILLADAINSGTLKQSSRNSLLAKMEKEIAELVLKNNYMQTQVLSLETNQSSNRMPLQSDSIEKLQAKGLLNRAIEHLPDRNALVIRYENRHWLTRPELAVLLSYSKMDLYQSILDSRLPDDPVLEQDINDYFPQILLKKFRTEIQNHRLKREIIATHLTNNLIGMMGPNFHLQTASLTGANIDDVARAYIVARNLVDLDTIQQLIEKLDNIASVQLQQTILQGMQDTVQSIVFWLLRHQAAPLDVSSLIKLYDKPVKELIKGYRNSVVQWTSYGERDVVSEITSAGIKTQDIGIIKILPGLGRCCDVVSIATRHKKPVMFAAETYNLIATKLGLDWIQQAIQMLPVSSDWNQKARFSLAEQLRIAHFALVENILGASKSKEVQQNLTIWSDRKQKSVLAMKQMISTMQLEPTTDFAMLSVIVSEISRLGEL